MDANLVKGGTSGGVTCKYARYQVTSFIGNGDVIREGILIHLNPSVRGLDISRLEGWLSNDQSINDDTEGPYVDFIRMTSSTLQHLWSNIIWCTANGSFLFAVKI